MLWFFFFKQKKAYELRISDWSADVCSSDLVARATHGEQIDTFGCHQRRILAADHLLEIAQQPQLIDARKSAVELVGASLQHERRRSGGGGFNRRVRTHLAERLEQYV